MQEVKNNESHSYYPYCLELANIDIWWRYMSLHYTLCNAQNRENKWIRRVGWVEDHCTMYTLQPLYSQTIRAGQLTNFWIFSCELQLQQFRRFVTESVTHVTDSEKFVHLKVFCHTTVDERFLDEYKRFANLRNLGFIIIIYSQL